MSQLPSAATFPTILTVWPNVVVFSTLKVTATAVAVVQGAAVVVVAVAVGFVNVLVPVGSLLAVGVKLAGNEVAVAVEYVPAREVAEHTPGTDVAVDSPLAQLGGTTPARRAAAVRNAAYDQVRSRAESGAPEDRSNCSAIDPFDWMYWETTPMKPSA